RGSQPSFSPLTDDLAEASEENRSAARAVADRLLTSLLPEFVVLSTHPNVDVRAAALRLLASRTEPAALQALGRALHTIDESTTRAALAAIAEHSNPAVASDVLRLLGPDEPWPLRRLAAQTLRHLAPVGLPDELHGETVNALRERVRSDPNAF